MDEKSSIQVLTRALRIIDVLSDCSENMSLAEIATLTGIAKSTVFRILKVLKEEGFVAQNSSGQYYMTLRFCTISRRILEKTRIINLAQPNIKRLGSIVNQTVHLVKREEDEIVYVDRLESASSPFHMTSVVGKRRVMHATAVGKSILAQLSDEEISAYWETVDKEQLTPYTIMDFESLQQEVAIIRAKGYAVDNQENTLGVRCVGACVMDYIGTPTYAISISGLSELMTDEKIEMVAPFLLTTAKSISASLSSK